MKKFFTILALFSLTVTFAQQGTVTIEDIVQQQLLYRTANGRIYNSVTGDIVDSVKTKKDTIYVQVICQFHTWAEIWSVGDDGSSGSKQSITSVRVETKRQERTLEWGRWHEPLLSSDRISWHHPINIYNNCWVAKKSVWLDPIEKCYHLFPIQNE